MMRAIRNCLSWALPVASALSLFVCSSAWADSRVVVRAFPGPKGAQVRQIVISELKDRGFEIVANKDVDRVAKERGVRADEPPGRIEISGQLTIHAWIDGRVSRTKGALTAVITVREGFGDEQLAELTVTRKRSGPLVLMVRREFWKVTGPAIETARAPGTPLPSDSETVQGPAQQNEAAVIVPPAPVQAPTNPAWPAEVTQKFDSAGGGQPVARKEEGKESKLSVFEVTVSLNTLARTLRFRDAFAQGASDYQLAAAPLVSGSARFYPGAFAKPIAAGCIGLDGSVQRAFGLGSQSAEGVTYKTKFEGYTGSLIGRIPLARHEINVLAGYGLQRFVIEGAPFTSPPVPSVEYRHIRVGGAARLALGARAKLGFDASWLLILGTGELGSAAWFPRNAGFGLEGAFYVDVRLIGGLAARARASYQRSAFEFGRQPNSQRSERGVVDTYITAGLGLSYAY